MANTPSTMLPLGTPLPPLVLLDTVSGRNVDAAQLAKGRKGLLVAFICNHCPFVQHIRDEFVRVSHAALDEGFAVVAVNSNDEQAYPQDAPPEMRKLAELEGWRFPYAFDATQDVARSFGAACTPDLYLFGPDLKLSYRGQFDDSRPSNGKAVTGASIVDSGRLPSQDQKPSIGCSIKWKPERTAR